MRRLLWGPLAMAFAACPAPGDGAGVFVVGPAGGTFEYLGARVIVPANALAQETTLTIRSVSQGIPEVPERTRISFGYRIDPSSAIFQSPFELELPYREDMLPSAGIDPSTYDMRRAGADNPFLQLGSPSTVVDRKVVTARTDRVGLFWVTSPSKPAVSKVLLTPPGNVVLRVGETQQFSAEVVDFAGAALPGVAVSWSIAAARVAKVDATGLVEALAPGTATLTVSASDKFVRATVSVIGDTVGPSTFAFENPFPTGNDLLGGAIAGGDAFFVGGNGTVLSRSAAGEWVRRFSAPGTELRAIAGAPSGAGVAVGVSAIVSAPDPSGVLIEVAGANAAPSLKAFAAIDPRAVWFDGTYGMAVGEGNDVLIRRDGAWVREYSPSWETLLHVVGDAAGGFVTVGSRGSLYIFDPITQTWDSLFNTQLSVLLVSAAITGADGSEAWAVGGNKLWHFQGTGWSVINLPPTPLFDELTAVGVVDGRVAIGARQADRGWLFLYEPGTATFTSSPMRGPQIARAIFGSGTSGYAVGDYGAVWQYANGTFTEVSSGFYGDVADVYSTAALTVAAVNECADAACTTRVGKVMQRTSTGGWEELGQPFTGPLFSVAVRGPNDVFAGGDRVVWRFGTDGWTPMSVPAKVNDLAICGTDVWAVGNLGMIFTGQSSLAPLNLAAGIDWWAVSCRDASEVWIAGDRSLIAVRASRPVGINDPEVFHPFYRAVWSPGFNEAYAFGDAHYGVYWNTRNLTVYRNPGGIAADVISDLWGSSPDNLYAVGSTVTPVAFGYAIRFNGAEWRLVDSGAHRPGTAIHGSSATDIYLVTPGGGILRGVPP
jgi:hypothetical protein